MRSSFRRQGDRYTLALAMQFRGLLFCYDTHETVLVGLLLTGVRAQK